MTTGIHHGDSGNNATVGVGAGARSASFDVAGGFGGRGYDQHQVDAWVQQANTHIADLDRQRTELTERVQQLEAQAAELSGRVRGDDDIIQQSVSILTTAQKTADATVKNADEYSGKIMKEAREHHDAAIRKARQMIEEAEQATREARQEVERSTADHAELQRQSMYLQTLLETAKVNLTSTLEGTLRHIATQFGHASSRAAEAATRQPERR